MKKRQYSKTTRLVGGMFKAYLKILTATVNLEIIGLEKIKKKQLLGYWHGDSLPMELVLGQIITKVDDINVIVTADKRGDYIDQILSEYGAKSIRLPDGLKMRPFFKELIQSGKKTEGILAASLDGPLGPLHEPKKLLFLLAAESNKEIIYIHFTYKRVLRLKNRWDNYIIVFPFSEIIAQTISLGVISKEDLKTFSDIKEKILY